MKLRILTTIVLLSAMELIQLAAARPSLSQTDLNTQLQEALCAQNWGRAIQVIDQMKKVAGRENASQLNFFRGQLEVIARENADVPEWKEACPAPEIPTTDQPPTIPDPSTEVPAITQP
jgi:hypothetical protein